MALSTDVLSTTLDLYVQDAADLLVKRTPLLYWAERKGYMKKVSGGAQIRVPVYVANHSEIVEHTTGYEPYSTVVRDVADRATYELMYYSEPIRISKKEEMHNASEQQVIDIVQARTDRVMSQFRQAYEQQILAGDVATMPSLGSLNGVVSTSGYLEDAAPGSQANTVGGLSKASITAAGWQNQWGDIANSFSTNGEAVLIAANTAIRDLSPDGEGTHLIIASLAAFNNLRRFLGARERYIDEKALEKVGRMVLMWNGAPVEASSMMPTNTGVGTDEVSFYMLNFSGVTPYFHKDFFFATSKFRELENAPVLQAVVEVGTQLVAQHLGSQAIITRGDTY